MSTLVTRLSLPRPSPPPPSFFQSFHVYNAIDIVSGLSLHSSRIHGQHAIGMSASCIIQFPAKARSGFASCRITRRELPRCIYKSSARIQFRIDRSIASHRMWIRNEFYQIDPPSPRGEEFCWTYDATMFLVFLLLFIASFIADYCYKE